MHGSGVTLAWRQVKATREWHNVKRTRQQVQRNRNLPQRKENARRHASARQHRQTIGNSGGGSAALRNRNYEEMVVEEGEDIGGSSRFT